MIGLVWARDEERIREMKNSSEKVSRMDIPLPGEWKDDRKHDEKTRSNELLD